jgi:centrosomal CEP192-like protein
VRNRIKPAMRAGLFLVLIMLAVSAIGCGGGAQTASGSPTPTPAPSPTPVSGSPSLSATPSSLAFGTQVLNTAMTQTVKITNTGSIAVAITQGTITGPGFTVGVTTPINLNVGQSLSVPVVFDPGTAGTVNGSLALVSNGTTLLSVPLSGTGLAPLAHSVDVTWAASTSTPLQGYNVYRSTASGGPYTKLSPTLSPTTLLFTDTTPLSGKQYFYVVTALNTSGAESSASSEVAVTIPVP